MALHPVRLPRAAAHLFRIVALQKRLLKALADPTLNPGAVDTAWVQNLWKMLNPGWVQKFCLDGQEDRIKAIASATLAARRALHQEFCRQNKAQDWPTAGGNFQDLITLPDFNAALVEQVKDFFGRCYKSLSHRTKDDWTGYEFPKKGAISNASYKELFRVEYPTKVVCPYCDGDIGTPELDHYLPKSRFPLLACSPWNLIPVCRSCNDMITAKGASPMITLGPVRSTADWLHPFFLPASKQAQIVLSGAPKISIPQLQSPNPIEQRRLDSHSTAIGSLSTRWTNTAASYYDNLVAKVRRHVSVGPVDFIVKMELNDHLAVRGREPSSMVRVAVCRAILNLRPEYVEEFTEANPPTLA